MHIRTNILAAGIAALVATPLAGAAPSTTPAPQVTPDAMTIPAVALSYRGQYLAWITAERHRTTLMLASSAGRNAHAVPIPGGCAETALSWARRWNTLAVLTQCPTTAAGGAHGALWVVDVGLRKAVPRKVADIQGTASDPQWRTDDKVIAFLRVPEGATLHSIAAVPVAGGTPQRTTPAGWNIRDYRLLPQNGGVLYTADARAAPASQAPALYVQTGRVPKVLFDPATAKGALHGLRVSLPDVNPWLPRTVLFLGRQPGATSSGRLYTLRPGHDPGPYIYGSRQIAWYTSQGVGNVTVYTVQVDGGVCVSFGLDPFTTDYPPSQGRYAFTVRGTINAGPVPFSVALPSTNDFPNGAWGAHAGGSGYAGANVAFVQTLPGQPPVIRAGRFSTTAPPIVWMAGASRVAMAAH
ncbi:MAG TPA: hypothetical protein VF292_00090 [Rhodanobacteraceae bacterium]